VERRDGGTWKEIRRSFRRLAAGRQVLALVRLASKSRLRPAAYRVTTIATDAAGNVSSPVRRTSRVKR
jgi:hypothetical protein